MSTRLASLEIETVDPAASAQFWYVMLGGRVARRSDDSYRLVATESDGCGIDLVFVPSREYKIGKNRVHLDLATDDIDEYRVLTGLADDLGARRVNVGQGPGVPWTVFTDPDGNEFCVLEPRDLYRRTGPLAALVVDAVNPAELAAFWESATAWPRLHSGENSAALRASEDSGPWIEFLLVPDAKKSVNRIRFDLELVEVDCSDGCGSDRDDAVSWLLGKGAKRSGHSAFLADPEGNEFRVLSACSADHPGAAIPSGYGNPLRQSGHRRG